MPFESARKKIAIIFGNNLIEELNIYLFSH